MPAWIEYALIGMIVGAVLTGTAFSADVFDRVFRRRTAHSRLSAQASPEREASALRLLLKPAGEGQPNPLFAHVVSLYRQSGAKIRPTALVGIGCAAAGVCFYIVQNALGNAVAGLFIGAIAGALTPYALLGFQRTRRRNAFVAQLPEAIDVIVRSLRAGHPLSVAIGLVGRDLAEPAGVEFAAVAKEMSFGLDMESATRNMAQRVGSPEVEVLASAIAIQQRTGGNLAEVLTRLATMLRDRARLRAKAKALSSEGRVTGIFLSALPFGMFFVLNVLNPKYYGDVRDNPIVVPVLLFTVCWMIVGIVIIQRMVSIKA